MTRADHAVDAGEAIESPPVDSSSEEEPESPDANPGENAEETHSKRPESRESEVFDADGNGSTTTDAGLSITRQSPATTTASITLDDAVSRVWSTLANVEDFQDALVDAAIEVATGRTPIEVLDVLDDAGVDALNGAYRSLIERVGRGDRSAVFDLVRETRRLGRGRSPIEDVIAAARLFELADGVTPTIEVRVVDEFRDLRASTRRDVCRLVSTLARGAEVRLVATGYLQRWLVETHRSNLPVSREDITSPGSGVLDERIETARSTLDPDGFAVDVLRTIAGETTETATYSRLYSEYERTESRVRQVVGDLVDLDLAATFDAVDGRAVELLPAGREYLDALDEEIARQRRLQDCVSDPGKLSDHSRVTPSKDGRPPTDDGCGDRPSAPADATYLSRSHHAAAVASGVDAGIALVDHPVDGRENGLERGWSYDDAGDRLVVSAEYHNPLQYWVSTARALTNWRTFRHVLDADRLDEDVFAEVPTAVLRDARCLGYLSDADTNGEDYIAALEAAREDLLDLTGKLAREEYDDRDRFRGTVTRNALGLASTLIHLLDLAGVEVVREVRLPEFSRNFDGDRTDDLVASIAKAAAIQSRYGEFAAYRQLFETRDEKREAAFSPSVDATDPVGRLAGSFVLVGDGVDALEGALVERLRSPGALHDDAPEFAVSIEVETSPSRSAFASVTRAVLDAKNIEATRDAVSIIEAFTSTAYDAATALNALGSEEFPREVRVDELRYALATLPSERLFPEASPTVSKLVSSLLDIERPVSKGDLADLAGVSSRSVRTHLDRLVAFDVVREVDGGYRLALSTSDERHVDVLPWYSRPNTDRDDHRDATEKGVVASIAFDYDLDAGDAVLDALGSIETLQTPPEVRREILDIWPWSRPLLGAARAFASEELDHRDGDRRTVAFGASITQIPITSTSSPPSSLAVESGQVDTTEKISGR